MIRETLGNVHLPPTFTENIPTMPAAASRYPMFALTVPMSSGRSASWPLLYTEPTACASIVSANCDPMVCASR